VSSDAELHRARVVPFAFHGARLRFELAHTLFSSAGIDPGSALLLRVLQGHLLTLPSGAVRRVLDLGCGHGTLGIVLHALDPTREITYTDRDSLALDYTIRNLELNGLATSAPAATVRGSLGYDDIGVGERYDLIVSNIPGKAGAAVIAHLVTGSAQIGRPGAIVAFVVVKPLAPEVARLLASPHFESIERRATNSHQVFINRIAPGPVADGPVAAAGFERGLYDRHNGRFRVGPMSWTARTVVGLDEFDNLSHPTRLVAAAISSTGSGRAVIVNPGQGHRAVVAARSGWTPQVLVARDLLALRASARCLSDAGEPEPQLFHTTSVDLSVLTGTNRLVLHAPDKVHVPWLTAWVERYLASEPPAAGGERHLVVSGRAGPLGRLEAETLRRWRGRVAFKQSERGYRVLRYVIRCR
jgi:SAM-dependent methyltransferase